MKDRIKDLAQEAGYIDRGNNHTAYAKFNHEEFAELLIKECAKVADFADENKCEWIGGNILTHFGVK